MSSSGVRSVKYDDLIRLQEKGEDSPFLAARLQFQESAALLNQHIRPMVGKRRVFPTMVIPQASGRVGISDPPVGNFTADPMYGPRGLRDVVRPNPGTTWVCADWSAVEGWIVSHRCQDPVDLEAKSRGLDLHTVTAIRMFKYPDPPFEPTDENLASSGGISWCQEVGFRKEIRDGVKNTRYTMQYAKNPAAVRRYAVKLGLQPNKLEQFGRLYLQSKPQLRLWKEKIWEDVWRRREARTAFGRRRRFAGDPLYGTPEWHKYKAKVEKEGLNHEVQGTVADMMKITQVSLNMIGCRMVLQRHDGWYSEVPEGWDRMSEYKAIVEREWTIDGRPFTCPAEYEVIRG